MFTITISPASSGDFIVRAIDISGKPINDNRFVSYKSAHEHARLLRTFLVNARIEDLFDGLLDVNDVERIYR